MQEIDICEVQGSVTCTYKRNAKPLTANTACGYEGVCIYKNTVEVKGK